MTQRHYESYQESVKKDLPIGFNDYLVRVGHFDKFKDIASRIKDGDRYLENLNAHKSLLLTVLKDFYKDVPFSTNSGFDLIKFKSAVITFSKLVWISHYEEDNVPKYDRPVFSTWEMVTAFTLPPERAQNLLNVKGDKILTPDLKLVPMKEVNQPLVKDWMLPL